MKTLKILFLTALILSTSYTVFAEELPADQNGFFEYDGKIYTYHNAWNSPNFENTSFDNYCGVALCKETKILVDNPYIYQDNHLLNNGSVIYGITERGYMTVKSQDENIKFVGENNGYDRGYIIVENRIINQTRIYQNTRFGNQYIYKIGELDYETYTYELITKGDKRIYTNTYLLSKDTNQVYLNNSIISSFDTVFEAEDIIFLYGKDLIRIKETPYLLVGRRYITDPTISKYFDYESKENLPPSIIIEDGSLQYILENINIENKTVRTSIGLSSYAKNYIQEYIDTKDFDQEAVIQSLYNLGVAHYSENRNGIRNYKINSNTRQGILKEVVLAYVLKVVRDSRSKS